MPLQIINFEQKSFRCLNIPIKVIFYLFVIKLLQKKHNYNIEGTVSQIISIFSKKNIYYVTSNILCDFFHHTYYVIKEN
jgi:hypothetical protein